MFISVQVDATKAIVKLERAEASTREAVRAEVVSLTKQLAQQVRANLSGKVLNMRSGRLYNSITNEMIEDTTSIIGEVATRGVPYAAIHEYGGVIKHPGSNKFQAWMGAAGMVYTHFTRAHDIPIPERSYMRSALAEMRDSIVARLTNAAKTGARAA